MTNTEKVLSRKDGSSLIVGVVLGFLVYQLLVQLVGPLVNQIGPQSDMAPPLAAADFYIPAIAFVLQLFALELVVTLAVVIRQVAYKKSAPAKKKK